MRSFCVGLALLFLLSPFSGAPASANGDAIEIDVRSDAKLLAARQSDVTAKVRAGDPFAQYLSVTFPRPQIADALKRDLMGADVVAAANPEAVTAIRAGTTDPDEKVRDAAQTSLSRVRLDAARAPKQP